MKRERVNWYLTLEARIPRGTGQVNYDVNRQTRMEMVGWSAEETLR